MKIATLLGLSLAGSLFMIERGALMAVAEDPPVSVVNLLLTVPVAERKKVVEEFKAIRTREVEGLIGIVTKSSGPLRESERIDVNAVECHAARLIGLMRAPEAVPVFQKLVAVRDSTFSVVSDQSTPDWFSFPFAVALSDIGMPAAAPLLQQIQSSTSNSTEFQVACVTLEKILGNDLAKAALQQHAEKSQEPQQGEWLAAAIKQVEIGHIRWSAMAANDFRLE